MKTIYVDKIIPLNCSFEKDDWMECGAYELAHNEIICHMESDDDNE